MKLENGMIQIYTGNGKGKSTAAIGQGIRAAGNGLNVIMIQFLKSNETGELKILGNLVENFKLIRMESRKDFVWNLNKEQIEELKIEINNEYNYALELLKNNECDVLILDEIFGVLKNGFLNESDIINLFENKRNETEIILTGRNAPQSIIERADLVTEMVEVKHYFSKGVSARKGIEF
ncbi:cob(I)yrinic acid a,c-diamide adenosyltransferase [Clostridium sp. 'White wine YQ']|uniref:cob(I)yrinic acid a,c-diamide adenosyltransferase n=1 Tax=Clostridium sp. 'White wine YQ' TaxID=3027474 RepID=UPI0023667AEE|nr:cob(I)yrinic acid a,c-diamide adenosyltransferase [Clostridium sp. 'White wine YQ']MDD7794017.1 cob(I)yrinic acid a,c-diamide adenosyltransferase [Clostridium sp. 'White wine YQ']